MKVLDRYLVRELVIPILYFSLALIFLILIADLFDNLDEFLKHKISFLVFIKYYISLIPYSFTQTISWASWLGTLFLLVHLGFHNETTAMKAAGLKITTIVKPVLFTGLLIGIFTFLVSDRIVPVTYRVATELRNTYIEKKVQPSKGSDEIQTTYYFSHDKTYYFKTFSKSKGEVTDAIVLWFDPDRHVIIKKMLAKKGVWNEKSWEFSGVTEYQLDSQGRILGEPKTFVTKDYPEITFTPAELGAASSEIDYLTHAELKRWIEKLRDNGVQVGPEEVEMHYRLAIPWQGLIMMLITIPFLAHTTNRKAIAMNVLICVGLVFAYHVSGAVGVALGKAGKLFPFASAWTGNIIFAIAGLVYLDKANY